MPRTRMKAHDWNRGGRLALALSIAFLAGGCGGDGGSLALNPNDPPTGAPPVDSTPTAPPVDSTPVNPPPPPPITPPPGPPPDYTGIPFGPFGLWRSDSLNYGPQPFTGSHNYIDAGAVIQQINNARALGQRLVLAMSGGISDLFVTNGQFDMARWKRRMDTYNVDSIKAAVAAAVVDGTVVGNTLIDEPETKQWGDQINKAMIDEMATYAKNMFPTLPMGVNHGPPAYLKWRTSEQYHVVDYILYQFAHYVTKGDVAAWRDAVLAQAKSQGATVAMSLNILNGGPQDRDGTWDCKGQPGKGKKSPNCRINPTDLVNWAKQLAPYGCFLVLWRYDPAYMDDPANIEAFREIAEVTASQPKRSCKRQ